MPEKEPVVVNGELIGWRITTSDEFMDVWTADGEKITIQTQKGSTVFVPVTDHA